jgi:hypothetical protein
VRAGWRDQREVAPLSEISPNVADPVAPRNYDSNGNYVSSNSTPLITAQRSTPFSTPGALNDLYLQFLYNLLIIFRLILNQPINYSLLIFR